MTKSSEIDVVINNGDDDDDDDNEALDYARSKAHEDVQALTCTLRPARPGPTRPGSALPDSA